MVNEMKMIKYRALDKNVIVVAVEGSIGDWTAYIAAVPGENHDEEWQLVKDEGSKLPQEVAEILFPEFAKNFEWRA